MPETDFDLLRSDLEAAVRPPDFADLRARRSRRTIHNSVRLGAAGIVAVAMIAAAALWGVPFVRSNQAAAGSAGSAASSRFAFRSTGRVGSPGVLVHGNPPASPGIDTFVLDTISGTCAKTCAPGTHHVLSLRERDVTEPGWRTIDSHLPGGDNVTAAALGPLLADDIGDLWYSIAGTIYSSTDAGHTWRSDVVDPDPAVIAGPSAGVAGSALITIGARMFFVVSGRPPIPLALPAGTTAVDSLSYFGAASNTKPGTILAALVVTIDGSARVFSRLPEGPWIADPTPPCPGAATAAVATSNIGDAADPVGTVSQDVICPGTTVGTSILRTAHNDGATLSTPLTLHGPVSDWTPLLIAGGGAWVVSRTGTVLRMPWLGPGRYDQLINETPAHVAGHTLVAVYGGTLATYRTLDFIDLTAKRIYSTNDFGKTWQYMPL